MMYGLLLASGHGLSVNIPDKFVHCTVVMDDAEVRLVLLNPAVYFTNLFRGTFGIFHHTEGTTCQHAMTNTPKMPFPHSNCHTGLLAPALHSNKHANYFLLLRISNNEPESYFMWTLTLWWRGTKKKKRTWPSTESVQSKEVLYVYLHILYSISLLRMTLQSINYCGTKLKLNLVSPVVNPNSPASFTGITTNTKMKVYLY